MNHMKSHRYSFPTRNHVMPTILSPNKCISRPSAFLGIFIDRNPSSAVVTNQIRPALAGDTSELLIGADFRNDRPEIPGTKKAF